MDDEKDSKQGFGCMGILWELGAWIVSTMLTTVGVTLLVIGAIIVSPTTNLPTVLPILGAPVAAYFLIRVGRGVLRDLRRRE